MSDVESQDHGHMALGTPGGVAAIPDQNGTVQDIPVPPDPDTLQAVADHTGGKFFNAPSAEQLAGVYSSLGVHLGSAPKRHEVTTWFAGAAGLLLVLAAAFGLLWFSRFP